MNMMPGFAPADGKAGEPTVLPWSFRVHVPKGKVCTVLNGCNEPIGIIEGTTHLHLSEMIRIIEQAFMERDQLIDEGRFKENQQQRLVQRSR